MKSRSREGRDVGESMKIPTGYSDTVSESPRHYYGLHNQGATCYLNSILQVLFMTREIHNRLEEDSEATGQELRKLFENLKEKTCGTKRITRILNITNVYQQRDAAECLDMILQKVGPGVSEVFKGELKYSTVCSEGHIINDEVNPFWSLQLSLKDSNDQTFNVESSFEKMFAAKLFSGENLVFCDQCDKETEATSECEMKDFPRTLVLLLKRFELNYNTMSHVKSHRCVEVPRVLRRKKKTFRLYGIVNHMGGLESGHYTATIRSRETKTWYEFDDSCVREVGEQPFLNNGTYRSHTAYLLVYRASKKQKEELNEQDQIVYLDEQDGNNRKYRGVEEEVEAHDKERQEEHEEYQGPVTKSQKKPSHVGRKDRNSSGFNWEDSESFLHPQNQIVPQRTNSGTNARDRNENSTKTKKLGVWSFMAVCVLLLILVITMTVIFS